MKAFARIIMKDPNGHYLLIKNTNFIGWTVPGGKVEPGESPLEAAKRETFEEIDVQVIDAIEVYQGEIQFGNQNWKGYFYFGTQVSGTPLNKELHKIEALRFSKTFNPEDFHPTLHDVVTHLSTCPQVIKNETLWV